MAKQTLADKLAKKIITEDCKKAKAEEKAIKAQKKAQEKAAAYAEKMAPVVEKRLSKIFNDVSDQQIVDALNDGGELTLILRRRLPYFDEALAKATDGYKNLSERLNQVGAKITDIDFEDLPLSWDTYISETFIRGEITLDLEWNSADFKAQAKQAARNLKM